MKSNQMSLEAIQTHELDLIINSAPKELILAVFTEIKNLTNEKIK